MGALGPREAGRSSTRDDTDHSDVVGRAVWLGVDALTGAALFAGQRRELRVPLAAPVAQSGAGDFIAVREACVPGRLTEGAEVTTRRERAEHVVFPDGWRQDRNGLNWRGPRPRDAEEQWLAAVHMPVWACRTVLTIGARRIERLQDIDRSGLRAEGLFPFFGARRRFRQRWDRLHPAPGLRWRDNPEVVVFTICKSPNRAEPAPDFRE